MTARIAVYGLCFLALAVAWGSTCVIWRAAELGDLVAPLENREFEGLSVIAVGTGGAYENPERRGPALAVGSGQSVWLVDAGRGVAAGLRAVKIPVAQPDTLFLTSLLPENTLGIDDLLMTGFLQGREQPLLLIGPPGTAELARAITTAHAPTAAAMSEALALSPAGATLEALEIDGDWKQTRGPLHVRAAAVGGGPLPALIWSFQPAASGGSEARRPRIVISGAGWGDETLIAFAEGADLLVHEAAYIPTPADVEAAELDLDLEQLAREEKLHTGLNDVGGLAARARVAAFALIRLRPPPFYDLQITQIVSRQYSGDVIVPEDGDDLWP